MEQLLSGVRKWLFWSTLLSLLPVAVLLYLGGPSAPQPVKYILIGIALVLAVWVGALTILQMAVAAGISRYNRVTTNQPRDN